MKEAGGVDSSRGSTPRALSAAREKKPPWVHCGACEGAWLVAHYAAESVG